MNVMDSYLAHGSGGLNATVNSAVAGSGVICDHAAPPPGFHYEQAPGTTGSCNWVLKPNAGTTGTLGGSDSGSGSGSGSTGTGSGSASGSNTSGGTGTARGGNSTGTGTSTTPAATSNITDQIKAGIIVALILWAAKHFLGTGKA